MRSVDHSYDTDAAGNAYLLLDQADDRVVSVVPVADDSSISHGYGQVPRVSVRNTDNKTEVILSDGLPSARQVIRVWSLD